MNQLPQYKTYGDLHIATKAQGSINFYYAFLNAFLPANLEALPNACSIRIS
jgi:hypothetical protein